MCFFDSPVGRCEAVKEMVLLDETQMECAREHGCPPGFECPLAGYFVNVSGLSDEKADEMAAKSTDAALEKARHPRVTRKAATVLTT